MHQVPFDEFCHRLGVDPVTGLTTGEAARRLQHDGPNELIQRRREPELVIFMRQMTNLFSLLLLAGSVLSFIADYVEPGQGNAYIGAALLVVMLLNGSFSWYQQRKAERIMAGFRNMLPRLARVVRGGEIQEIPAAQVVRGDVLFLEEGEQVPADARLFDVAGLKVDNASLTGESEPQLRTTYPTDRHLLDSRNVVFSGTAVQAGEGKGIVFATAMKTQIGRTADLTQTVTAREIPIRREIARFTRIISFIAVIMGAAVFLVSLFVVANPVTAKLIFAIGIIVANVPEGLLPTVTLCLAGAARRMADQKALVKNLESVETLGCTTVVCTDKTGTLTVNRMAVQRLFLNECMHSDADASFEPEELEKLLLVAILCNNAHAAGDDGRSFLGDPTETALLEFAARFQDIRRVRHDFPRLYEEPFTGRTKMMVTVNEVAGKQVACMKGAPDVVIERCGTILINGQEVPFTQEHRSAYLNAYEDLARRGERVLLLACQEVPVRGSWQDEDLPSSGYTFIGLIGMFDPPRQEVPAAVRGIRAAGIRVVMITGDYQTTALAIARTVGIVSGADAAVITGEQLRTMRDEALEWELEREEVIFARTSPEQKLRIVQALQRRGEVVAVTGDGVNDAPALKHADIGVAMGRSGTDVAREAADIVLLDDNFATIFPAIQEGRRIFENLKKSIRYTVSHAVPEVMPYLAFLLFGIPLPLTVTLILAIDLGTDMLPAIALGKEQPERDIMLLPPRRRDERLVSPHLLLLAYGVFGTIEAAAGFYAYFSVLMTGGWRWGTSLAAGDPLYLKGVSAFFAAIVLCQVANGLVSKAHRQSLLRQGLFSNPLLLVGLGVGLLLAGTIVGLDALHPIFGNASLSLHEFFLAWPFAVALVLLDEARRWIIRQRMA
ncbi:HAD-IC family P-type ATPase [Geobacter sp. DSM 9736]|uniref:cation-translocating P-type ATPase n=1 Tax=Geobacter sp. DSM 9736 TaxID=1277350 RepID=UPI000B509329|nr:HAD-IC family P-type ATPase [Geobacter sp. DSM 9736]SNB46029.1 sodium/potassium-transporting ATPase subunit alpha [Geobacter sp. DSM 9736]